MADFKKSGCCDCAKNKGCPDAFTNFAAELCPEGACGSKKQDKK